VSEALRNGLAEILSSLEVHSRDRFSVLGRKFGAWEAGDEAAPASDDDAALSSDAQAVMADLLYQVLHCRADGMVTTDQATPPAELRDFLARLSRANSGAGPWHDEWMVERLLSDGRVVVSKGGIRFWADPGEFRCADTVRPGVVGQLRMPAEYRRLYPGYFAVLGDADSGGPGETIRLYWNLEAAGAERLVELFTRELNRIPLAFQLKVLSDPARFHRTDAAVLYLPREALRRSADLLELLYREVKTHCREEVSSYCLALAPGVGVAEDPGIPKTSFGLHRSGLLARAVAAPEVATAQPADRLPRLIEWLVEQGYPLSRFHLSPGSPEIPIARLDGRAH